MKDRLSEALEARVIAQKFTDELLSTSEDPTAT